ncbi:MAG: hypothetical protein HC892_00295 [Saprospiraceae bacterium]|nr:hypothetical protein [Saprospiraceae bacterium]
MCVMSDVRLFQGIDPEFDAEVSASNGVVVMYRKSDGQYYRVIRDNDTTFYVPVPNVPEKDTFGKINRDGYRSFYSPDFSGIEGADLK